MMNPTYERHDSERDLFAAMAKGDQSAFERLYRLYVKRVYQYAYTLVNDQSMAEDIVEETMIAVWRGARTFSGASRVSTWIFGIARHKSLDAIRRTSRRMREMDLEAAAELPAQAGTPMDDAQRRQQETIMAQAMSTLSREHQEVLRLVFYEELPYDEIACLLAIPTNTVKTRVFYAKRQLKQQLERLGQKEPTS